MFNVNKSHLWEQPQLPRAGGNWRCSASCLINLQIQTLSYSKQGLSYHRNLLSTALVTSAQDTSPHWKQISCKVEHTSQEKTCRCGQFFSSYENWPGSWRINCQGQWKRRHPQLVRTATHPR